MGSAMADRLLDRGVAVIAWDRDSEHLRALEGRGGERAGAPSEVVSGSSVVITMLADRPCGPRCGHAVARGWPEGTIWLQMSSVGAAEADELVRLAEAHGVTLVDAPVSGSTHPAEEGELTILASGPDSARTAASRSSTGVVPSALGGDAGMGSRLKLAANLWMIVMVTALAESMHLCRDMSLDQQQFIALLQDGPLAPSMRCRS